MAGKGHNRRKENTAQVESNWPTKWDAREEELRASECGSCNTVYDPNLDACPYCGAMDAP